MESYYDILNIVMPGVSWEPGIQETPTKSMRIPVPLLTVEYAVTALKAAKIVDRREHKRPVCNESALKDARLSFMENTEDVNYKTFMVLRELPDFIKEMLIT